MNRWIFLLVLCLAAPAYPWGPQGHRVASYIAKDWLSTDSASALSELLGDQTLAEASTWPDEMRSNPSPFWQKEAGPYHYVTVPPGKTYAEVGAPGKGDGVTALAAFRATLQDPSATRAHKQLALRFSIHIVQDLHQPMHVGNGKDRGGTRFSIRLEGKKRNLHWLWDSGLFRAAGYSDRALAQALRMQAKSQDEAAWLEPDPLVWIAESATLRDQIYPTQGRELPQDYLDDSLPLARQRLHQAGIRTAAYLNWLFSDEESVSASVTSTGL